MGTLLRTAVVGTLLLQVSASGVALAPRESLGDERYRVDHPLKRPQGSRLVWQDDFSGTDLDQGRWSYDTSRNKLGWHNGEKQYYSAGRPENLRVSSGRLIIEARRERLSAAAYPDWGGQEYTSAKVMTKGNAAWRHGFFEVRAKLPCARGTWPAIWMMPESGRWPDDGEIDIMEHVGAEPNRVHATVHTALFVHSKGTQRGATLSLPTSCSSFHRYQLLWTPEAITIGVDDRAFMRVRNDQPGGRGAWPFDRPFHMILNLAVGSSWSTGGRGVDDASLPQRFEVDYVRVWQLPGRP